MLILTRRIGECLIINDGQIKIYVMGVHGKQVRIGIDAPKEIEVYREEIYERIKKEREGELVHDCLPDATGSRVL